jgi:hypothetical protein
MNQRIGARPWLAHAQHDLAATLLAQGRPADAKRARLLLSRALATYRELGMETHAAEVRRFETKLRPVFADHE